MGQQGTTLYSLALINQRNMAGRNFTKEPYTFTKYEIRDTFFCSRKYYFCLLKTRAWEKYVTMPFPYPDAKIYRRDYIYII